MNGSEHGSVADRAADNGDILLKFVPVNVAEHALAKFGRHALHLAANRCIFGGQTRMISACVDDAKRMVAGSEVKIDLFDYGLSGVVEIYLNEAADGAGHLIHQTAGLAEILILGELRYLRYLNGADFAVVIEIIEHRAEQHFKRRRGRETRAGEDVRSGSRATPAEGFRTHRFESEVPLSCSTGEIAVSFILSGVALLAGFVSVSTASAQAYGTADTNAPELRVPKSVQPAIDYWMRDTWATLGPDGYYYITGTTSTPDRHFPGQRHCWDWNDGLYLWRSKDLKIWEAMGRIWSMEKDGTWQKDPKVYKEGEKYAKKSINNDPMDNRFHAVWAPEMHYIKSAKNWFIVACMNQSAGGRGSFILRSTTGKPEGPYENIEGNEDKAIFPNIDGSLFEDTDGTVYFVGHNHYIARMKPDMSGLAEEIKTLKESKYSPEPYVEGAFIFKYDGKYHLVQAIWAHRTVKGDTYVEKEGLTNKKTRYSYDCIIATADNVYGPYGKRYNAITGGGHNNLFQDKDGNWWATMFFNPRGAQAAEYKVTCRPGLIPMLYENGKFKPNHNYQAK